MHTSQTLENSIMGIDHMTDPFIGWQVLIPARGYNRGVYSVSYQASFSELDVLACLIGAGGPASSVQKDSQVKWRYMNAVPEYH
jgi:hypothetical protein